MSFHQLKSFLLVKMITHWSNKGALTGWYQLSYVGSLMPGWGGGGNLGISGWGCAAETLEPLT